ncbi:Magnesium and cobalt efflux protein CorC [invertebrate metagenome]|uniref:Magnesium and cobalt efflux protein CorC n=1 Tax=invertebrate metagenome TaxID=1711999 RepID=A0A484HDF3_9ZZZZ
MHEIPEQRQRYTDERDTSDDDQSLIRVVSVWLKELLKTHLGESETRNTVEEIIEECNNGGNAIDEHERLLLSNVLHMHNITARDIMVPRADIVAIEASNSLKQIVKVMASTGHSRLPVFRNTLDDILGMVHIKDIIIVGPAGRSISWESIVRPILFIAPSVRIMNLLIEMRARRTHMALVVDEYGGVDGLITIEDLVEALVGSIEDEHDIGAKPQFLLYEDGITAEADARLSLETFEEHVGQVLSSDEREGTSTLGGLIFYLASRVPARGELITHPSGMKFEVLDADARRVKHLRVHNLQRPLEQAIPDF